MSFPFILVISIRVKRLQSALGSQDTSRHKQQSTKATRSPFVIPTGAKRSGGICSVPQPSTNPKTLHATSSNQRRQHALHLSSRPERSEAEGSAVRSCSQTNPKTLQATSSNQRRQHTLHLSSRPERSEAEGSAVCSCSQTNPKTLHATSSNQRKPSLVRGWGTLQIPPLRFAPVGMTKVRVVAFPLQLLAAGTLQVCSAALRSG
jgi:hypothetical protein